MISVKNFEGLSEVMKGFTPFTILQTKPDPYFPGVFLMLIRFTEDNEYGLCIYDTNKQSFVEEPGSLEDYDTTPEELTKKHGFTFDHK